MPGSKRDLDDELLETAFETVETVRAGRCVVTLERDLTVQCPHDDLTDEYELTIEYLPTDDRCLELQSLATFLDEFESVAASQEAVCHFLAHFLFTQFQPEWIEIEVGGEHYGIETTTSKRREI